MKSKILTIIIFTALLIGSLLPGFVHHREEFAGVSMGEAQLSGYKQVQPTAELRAEAYMLRGNYHQVYSLLSDKFLSPNGAALLIKAELALGEDSKAFASINVYRSNPMIAGMEGLYLANRGYYQSAREYITYQQEAGGSPKPELELDLCQVLLRLGQWEQAARVLAGLDNSWFEATVVKGDLALARKDYQQAWQLYTQVIDKGYLTQDTNFLAKYAIASLGAEKDCSSTLSIIRQQDPQSGLANYVEAQADIRKGDLLSAQGKLQGALNLGLPARLRPQIMAMNDEITARAAAEPAIQAVIARGGH